MAWYRSAREALLAVGDAKGEPRRGTDDVVCGYYYPVTDFDPAAPGNQWTGNAFDDGTAITP
jgi:hypothetical protein